MKRNAMGMVIPAAIAALAFVPVTSGQQSPPEFEVTSVKANHSLTGPSAISGATPGRFVATNTPLRFIILYAYELMDHQLIGAPDWTASTGFDVTGTYHGKEATDHDVRLMVQQLLSDRFGLTAHREQREVPTYFLTLARKDGRLGPQLRRSDVDCEKWIAEKRPKVDAGGPAGHALRETACLHDDGDAPVPFRGHENDGATGSNFAEHGGASGG